MKTCLHFYKDHLKHNTLKLLTLYPITLRELERIILVDHKTLEAYKTMSRSPSTSALLSIATTFGTTTDWLVGTSRKPYTEESIRQALDQSYMKFQQTIPLKVDKNGITKPVKLEAIANIIVLHQYKYILSETSFKSSKLKSINEWINEILETGEPKFSLESSGNKN